MSYNFIELEKRNTVGWFRFNRPPVNAVHWEMLEEFGPAFQELATSPDVRVIVLATSLAKNFSAGADLAAFADATPERMREWVDLTQNLAKQIRGAEKPVLAAIRGVAVGGGLEMSLHADLRFAAAGARLGQPEINIAFIPPVGGTQGLVRLVGRSNAFKMLYEGGLISAQEALSIGLVDQVYEDEALESEVQAYAEQLAQKPANALAAIRRCLIDGGSTTFEEGLEIEKAEANRLSAHPNFHIGIEAFLAKSKPAWK